VFGVERFFSDNVFTCSIITPTAGGGVCTAPFSVVNSGSTNNKTTTGAGVGGSFLWPVLPKYLELSGMAITGKGIGRYSAGQLPDVIVAPDGSLRAVKEVAGMAGAVWHPWVGTDIYGYAGIEKEDANFYTAATRRPRRSAPGDRRGNSEEGP